MGYGLRFASWRPFFLFISLWHGSLGIWPNFVEVSQTAVLPILAPGKTVQD